MPSALEMLILLGPQPRPALGEPYHLNGEERRYAEAVERRERVRQVLEIRETTHLVNSMRAHLDTLTRQVGVEGARLLDQFKSPPRVDLPPALEARRRRREDVRLAMQLGLDVGDSDGDCSSPPKRRAVTYAPEALGEARAIGSTATSLWRAAARATGTFSSLTKSKATSMRKAEAAAAVAASASASSGLAQSTTTSMQEADEASVRTRPSTSSILAEAGPSTKFNMATAGPSTKFNMATVGPSTKSNMATAGSSTKSNMVAGRPSAKSILAAVRAGTKSALNLTGSSSKSIDDASESSTRTTQAAPEPTPVGRSPISELAAAAAMRRAKATSMAKSVAVSSMAAMSAQRRAEATSASPSTAIKRTGAVLTLPNLSAKKRRMIGKAAPTPSPLPSKDRWKKVMKELSEAMAIPTVYTSKPEVKASTKPEVTVTSSEEGELCPMCQPCLYRARQAHRTNLQVVIPTFRHQLISEDESFEAMPGQKTPVTPIETFEFPRKVDRSPSSH